MEAPDNELLAIEVGPDDYAETAASDAPSVDRTFQSKEDFEAVKANYEAKAVDISPYKELLKAAPVLACNNSRSNHENASTTRLNKRDVQLLHYAIGELYYDKRFTDVVALCERIQLSCEVDRKTNEALTRWMTRAQQRMP